MSRVLFTSNRSLERAENLKSVYDAYEGEKEYANIWAKKDMDLSKYDLEITDELPTIACKKCIFISHGMGTGKSYGLQYKPMNYTNPDLITYAIASSKDHAKTVKVYTGLPKKRIIPLGMPRTDAYFKAQKEELDYKMALYAPTLRPWSIWQPNWDEIAKFLPNDYRFVAKPHMCTGDWGISHLRNIETVSCKVPSTPYLINADVLVTDYSSIMFDAMVMRKPVVLFAKDKGRYLRERGMYLPYPEYYSKYFYNTEEEMAKHLESAEWTDYDEKLRKIHCGACDGHSIERLLDLMESVL